MEDGPRVQKRPPPPELPGRLPAKNAPANRMRQSRKPRSPRDPLASHKRGHNPGRARRPEFGCRLCPARETPKARRGSELRAGTNKRSEEHTSELQSLAYLVCRLLLEKK